MNITSRSLAGLGNSIVGVKDKRMTSVPPVGERRLIPLSRGCVHST